MLSVLLGAFGAHILKNQLTSNQINIYQTGVDYQMYHSFAILFVGFYQLQVQSSRLLDSSAIAFITGIVLFSGSLYLLSVTNIRWIGVVTPIGGVAFIIGWLCLAMSAVKNLKLRGNLKNDN